MVFKNLLRLRVFRTSSSVRTRTFLNSDLSSSSSSSSSSDFLSIASYSSSSSSNHRKSRIPSSSNGTTQSHPSREKHRDQRENDSEEDEWWEDGELDTKPKMGDGESGGGVVLNNLAWGDRAHSIALDALSPFGDDMKLFSLRASPREAIFVRLDKLSDKYGCPSLEDLNTYSLEIKRRLDEAAERGEVPDDLGVLVSTPGAERLLRIPEDLHRFKELPMRVCHVSMEDSKHVEKIRVLELDSVETEARSCVWKVANVRENRDPLGKGRPLTRKLKDWRLRLLYEAHISVSLYTR